MRMYMFEGTSQEIAEVLETTKISMENTVLVKPSSPPTPSETEGGSSKFVTREFASLVLKRRALTPLTKAMFRKLLDAHPEWVSTAELCEAVECAPETARGVIGGFTTRMVRTDGYVEKTQFFQFLWNDQSETWAFRLSDTACEALQDVNLG